MDFTTEIYKLQSRVEFLREESDRMHALLMDACHQISDVYDVIAEVRAEVRTNAAYTKGQVLRIDKILDTIGDKLYPTFFKVFPEMVEVRDTLARAVKQAGKDPKTST